MYVFYVSGGSGEGHIPTILRPLLGPLKETLDFGDSEGSIYRISRVLETLRGSFVRILRVREARGRDRFLPS